MIISILNCDKHYGIGKRNGLLFSLPMDMAFFRNTTRGHVVAMGENTLLSFPNQKPLKDRVNIVLSQDPSHHYEGVENVHDFLSFLRLIKSYAKKEDVYIIGGASIYAQTLPYVDLVLLTKVDEDGGAEVFFPNLDENPDFVCIEEGEPLIDNGHPIRFTKYKNTARKEIE